MKPLQHARQNRAGFTLIEALMAILILSILLMGLIPAFIKAYNISHETSLREAAIDIAHEVLEETRCQGYSNVSSGNQTIERKIKKADILYKVKTSVASQYGGELKRVQVTVTWPFRGDNETYNAFTVIGEVDE